MGGAWRNKERLGGAASQGQRPRPFADLISPLGSAPTWTRLSCVQCSSQT